MASLIVTLSDGAVEFDLNECKAMVKSSARDARLVNKAFVKVVAKYFAQGVSPERILKGVQSLAEVSTTLYELANRLKHMVK
jgi:hypothetical protein